MKENEFKFFFTDVEKQGVIEFKRFLDTCGCKSEFFSGQSKNDNAMGTEISEILIAVIGSGAFTTVGSAIGIWIQRHREGKMTIDIDGKKMHVELENCTEKERDKVRKWFEKQIKKW